MRARAQRTSSADEILESAAHVFADHGYTGATLDAVARRLGLTRQGVLHYYPSKPLLFAAVLEREKSWAARATTGLADARATPLDALVAFIPSTDDSRRRVRLQHVLQGEAVAGNQVAREYVQERTALILEQVTQRVRTLADADRLMSGWTVTSATASIVALINGLQYLTLTDAEIDAVSAFHATVAHMTRGAQQ